MTSEEVIARMWEAYKAGMCKNLGLSSEEVTWTPAAREDFLRWLGDPEHFPELLKADTYRHTDIMCNCDETVPLGDKSQGCCCLD